MSIAKPSKNRFAGWPGLYVLMWLLCAAEIVQEVVQFAMGTDLGKRPDPGGLLIVATGFISGAVLYGFERNAFRGSAKDRYRAFCEIAFSPMMICFGSGRALDRTPASFLVVVAVVGLAAFGWITLMMFRLRREMEAMPL